MEHAVRQAPFDVLGVAEMFFDLSAQLIELQDLLVGERRFVLPLGFDLRFFRAAVVRG